MVTSVISYQVMISAALLVCLNQLFIPHPSICVLSVSQTSATLHFQAHSLVVYCCISVHTCVHILLDDPNKGFILILTMPPFYSLF